jgi:DNA excision repair protein ERCC-6-like 2
MLSSLPAHIARFSLTHHLPHLLLCHSLSLSLALPPPPCSATTKAAISQKRQDVVIVSYDCFRLRFAELNAIHWLCGVFDEVHKLKDVKSQITIKCMAFANPRHYGLTGTAMQNNYDELYTLLNWAQPGCLGSLKQMRARFIDPIKRGQRRDATFVEYVGGCVGVGV